MSWNPGCLFLLPSLYVFCLSFSVSAQRVWGLFMLPPRESRMPGSPFLLSGRNNLLFYCQSKEEESGAEEWQGGRELS